MKRIFIAIGLVSVSLFVAWMGYLFFCEKPVKKIEHYLVLVSEESIPAFSDGLNGDRLMEALQLQIDKMKGKNLDRNVCWGEMMVPRRRILKTLELFKELLEEKGLTSLEQEIAEHFLVFQSSGMKQKGDVLFTGYYQPVIDARKKPGGGYKYPVYRTPPDLQTFDLSKISSQYAGKKIGLRVENGKINSYFDREAIDDKMVLAGRELELVYLKDFLDRYMLHVQGSGIMKVEDGQEIRLGFAASNSFPYVSLGKLLQEDGKIKAKKMSLKAIRQYYKENPDEIAGYLNHNRRYIFFEEFTGNVAGSEGVELTPGRSIATDKTLFPGGGLAFIFCQRTVRNDEGKVVESCPIGRFVIDQDTGAAMEGPGRVDIFWGTGKEAGEIAGGIKEIGKLYYLLIKE